MVEVYYYLPNNAVNDAIECGLKLSVWYDKEVEIGGYNRKCLSALLNPKDDPQKYVSPEYTCVKLDLPPAYCYVADSLLYRVGLGNHEIMALYHKSVIPARDYIFGTYASPECLVTSTVIAGQISLLDKRMDSPVLYDNSRELYVNNIIEILKDEYPFFNETLLYLFYSRLAELRKVDRIIDSDNGIAVFIDRSREKVYTLQIPELDKELERRL